VGLKNFLMPFGGSADAARFAPAVLPLVFFAPKPSGSATCTQGAENDLPLAQSAGPCLGQQQSFQH